MFKHLGKLAEIKALYEKGTNITTLFKELENTKSNSLDAIQISYDLQAGSYIRLTRENQEFNDRYTSALASILTKFSFSTILEVGVGEATTFANLVRKLSPEITGYGFDISWSRIKYAKSYCKELGIKDATLFLGDLFNTPLLDSSIDIVYTSHSIEPNGSREIEALKELYRIAKKYVVLLEPSYEFASNEGKERMERLGYVKGLYAAARELNYNVIENRLFEVTINPLNPTGLIVIEKNESDGNVISPFACPITHSPLEKREEENCYFGKESLLAYPIVGKIPCLLPSNAIVATHLKEIDHV